MGCIQKTFMEREMQQFEEDIQNLSHQVKDDSYAQALYAALCNMRWKKDGEVYSCSWRYAGGLVAEMRGSTENMNYLEFYCSGIEDGSEKEGYVRCDIEDDLNSMGWECDPWPEDLNDVPIDKEYDYIKGRKL